MRTERCLINCLRRPRSVTPTGLRLTKPRLEMLPAFITSMRLSKDACGRFTSEREVLAVEVNGALVAGYTSISGRLRNMHCSVKCHVRPEYLRSSVKPSLSKVVHAFNGSRCANDPASAAIWTRRSVGSSTSPSRCSSPVTRTADFCVQSSLMKASPVVQRDG